MGEELFAMIAGAWTTVQKKRGGGRRCDELPELTRVAGGFRAWSEAYGGEWLPWCGLDDAAEVDDDNATNADQEDVWRAILNRETNLLVYEHVKSGRRVNMRPTHGRVVVEGLGEHGISVPNRGRTSVSVPKLFEPEGGEEGSEDEDERQARIMQAHALQREREASQTDCNLCHKPLVEPVRLTKCRCALCACCVERTVRYFKQCPACSAAVEVKGGKVTSDAKVLERSVALHHLETSDPESAAQRQYLTDLQLARSRVSRIILEYGNISRTNGSKISFTTFVKLALTEGNAASKSLISRVDFNINPGYSKPTASVKEPTEKKLGFAFEYAMARAYPCFISVFFSKESGLPNLAIQYVVQEEAKVTRRIVLDMPLVSRNRPGREIIFQAHPPRNGWIRFDGERTGVEFIPEAGSGINAASIAAHYSHPPQFLETGLGTLLPDIPSTKRSNSSSRHGAGTSCNSTPKVRSGSASGRRSTSSQNKS